MPIKTTALVSTLIPFDIVNIVVLIQLYGCWGKQAACFWLGKDYRII